MKRSSEGSGEDISKLGLQGGKTAFFYFKKD